MTQQKHVFAVALFSLFVALIVNVYFFGNQKKNPPLQPVEVPALEALTEHTKEFDSAQIIPVIDKALYVAIGYGLANSILLEGNDCVVIIDTMESEQASMKVKLDFEKITTKPVKGIIYTHYHPDHTLGSRVFMGEQTEVISHRTSLKHHFKLTNEITLKRGLKQFGVLLPRGEHINSGIGPALIVDEHSGADIVFPTKTFDDQLKIDLCGHSLELYHMPGETDDQISVWIPQFKALLPGDNIYRAFPNLYAIRGVPHRDTTKWFDSIDRMIQLEPSYIVPSHSRPIFGNENITQILTAYRDAIQFVHDQTVRFINKGYPPDKIVQEVKLPPHLHTHPFLQQFYGTVEWSVRSVYSGYLGWFNGESVDLFPLPRKEHAIKMVQLAGGLENLSTQVRRAIENKEFQWGLELAEYILAATAEEEQKVIEEAKKQKVTCLRGLAQFQISAPARNWYLTQAREVEGLVITPNKNQKRDFAQGAPLDILMRIITIRLDSLKSWNVNKSMSFDFLDLNVCNTIHVRNGVAVLILNCNKAADIHVTTTSTLFREMIVDKAKLLTPVLTGDFSVSTGILSFIDFFQMFDTVD